MNHSMGRALYWRATEGGYRRRPKIEVRTVTQGGIGSVVAVLDCGDRATDEAHGRLFAAAPELLAALVESLSNDELCNEGMRPVEGKPHSAECRDCQRILKARAIVAKVHAAGTDREGG